MKKIPSLLGRDSLLFYSEDDLTERDYIVSQLKRCVLSLLKGLNNAFVFYRIEAPCLIPSRYINEQYGKDDVFSIEPKLGDEKFSLRPETTKTSYLVANHLIKNVKGFKSPLCVWQVGKSFRVEKNDGARASTLRFNEFYQCEFQCIYSKDSKCDYMGGFISGITNEINLFNGMQLRVVESDRLPSYSERTMDLEVFYNGKFVEVASISLRNDFSGYDCLEIAFGVDRIQIIGNSFWGR